MNDAWNRAQRLLQAALEARRRNVPAEERRLLMEAASIAPANPQVQNSLGLRALADRDFEGARSAFAAAASADPKEAALWLNLATAQRALEDTGGEEASLEQALAIDRADFVAQLRTAELLQRTGRDAKAAKHWSNVLQLAAGINAPPPAVTEAVARGKAFLAAHNDSVAALLDERLGTASMTGPEARRFRACVEHAFGRRLIYRNQCAGIYYPFLPADEFFDRGHFEWLEDLEEKTVAIRAEALALLRNDAATIRPYVRQEPGTPVNTWSALDNSLDWSACFLWEYGVRNEAVCELCPATTAALEAVPQNHIPGRAPTAFFSILKAGAHIPPHTGVTNTRTIIHLPLVVPDGCRFRVGGETRPWREGEAFAFDDTIEHEAWNESAEPRIVLIFDVWNPYLTDAEQERLATFLELAAELEAAGA
jgi:aspartyl/asparaginyl beta-hydroxylase (cupin superfamily)